MFSSGLASDFVGISVCGILWPSARNYIRVRLDGESIGLNSASWYGFAFGKLPVMVTPNSR